MGETILIIDDDAGHRQPGTGGAGAARGIAVLRAYSGTEALLVCCKDTRPDLALLDLMLPGLSGEELLPRAAGQFR